MNIIKKLYQKLDWFFHADSAPYLGILILVFLVIVVTNFPFHSWLTGWDNLHPEFNFSLNFQRALHAVWQSNQGLGTYGGHGYAATLPHTVFLFMMSFFLPLMYLRSTFTFLMLLTGVLGVFFLVRKMLGQMPTSIKNSAALFSSLYYLLNFGTVENFYIQLEAFIVHYAALPWLLLSLLAFLETKSKKNLLIFTLITFWSSTQGFIPPLFFVYLMILGIFLATYIVHNITISRIKDAIVIVLITLAINSYWFLPVVHYSLTNSATYLNAYNNVTSTEDFILQNKKYGTLPNVALLKGFIIESIDSLSNGKIVTIFDFWQHHFSSPYVSIIGFAIFLIIILGLLRQLFQKKSYIYHASALSFIILFSLLTTDTPPFSFISALFQKIPILRQAFRVAFTKFSIGLSFFYAIAFGIGIATGMILIRKVFTQQLSQRLFLAFIMVCLLYFSSPIFKGYFLYQRTKITIPDVYFQLFNYFDTQNPDGRIANFPQGWHWGWSIYNWGYSGSGFLWYGIKQPILDRAFDAWGKENENYYWELSYAIYSENFDNVNKLLNKYDISWIVFDKNTIPYPNVKSVIYTNSLENYLDNAPNITKIKTFKSKNKNVKDIIVYKVLNNPATQTTILTSIPKIEPQYQYSDYDKAYLTYGNYYSDRSETNSIYYPFRSLFTKRDPQVDFSIIDTSTKFIFDKTIPSNFILSQQPALSLGNILHVVGTNLEITSKKNNLYQYQSTQDQYFLNHTQAECGESFDIQHAKQTVINNNILRFSSYNTENCYSINLNYPQRFSYLVQITSKHIQGKQLQLAVTNLQTRKPDIEIALTDKPDFTTENIIIPPMQNYGLGYQLVFNNISIGDQQTINDVKNISVQTFPYDNLSSIQLRGTNGIEHNNIIEYSESYNPDWKAYYVNNMGWFNTHFPFVFGKELQNHVLVNNWANGWKLDQQNNNLQNIVIIFRPQYLEFIGFGLIIVGFIFILKFKP